MLPMIVDHVGDNVGDCAGMAADLFESYEITIIAILGYSAFKTLHLPVARTAMPLIVAGIGTPISRRHHGRAGGADADKYGDGPDDRSQRVVTAPTLVGKLSSWRSSTSVSTT